MNTYSFQEAIITLAHPSRGRLTTNGQGLGSIGIDYSTDRSSIDVAADGTPVVNKIKNRTGSLKIEMQQTSDLHKDLIKLFNYLESAPASEWAQLSGIFKNRSTGEQKVLTGISVLKIPNSSYGQTVAMVSWEFLVADVQTDVV